MHAIFSAGVNQNHVAVVFHAFNIEAHDSIFHLAHDTPFWHMDAFYT